MQDMPYWGCTFFYNPEYRAGILDVVSSERTIQFSKPFKGAADLCVYAFDDTGEVHVEVLDVDANGFTINTPKDCKVHFIYGTHVDRGTFNVEKGYRYYVFDFPLSGNKDDVACCLTGYLPNGDDVSVQLVSVDKYGAYIKSPKACMVDYKIAWANDLGNNEAKYQAGMLQVVNGSQLVMYNNPLKNVGDLFIYAFDDTGEVHVETRNISTNGFVLDAPKNCTVYFIHGTDITGGVLNNVSKGEYFYAFDNPLDDKNTDVVCDVKGRLPNGDEVSVLVKEVNRFGVKLKSPKACMVDYKVAWVSKYN